MQEKFKLKGIGRSLARMTVLPILVLGIIITIFGIFWVKSSIEIEIHHELSAQAKLAANTFDTVYPGDYAINPSGNELIVTKGDTILNYDYDLIDSLKEASETDYTIFIGNLRVLTTLKSDDTRLTGTEANTKIQEEVLECEESHFYKNVNVLGNEFYAYYTPLYNSDGSCVGMIAAVKPDVGVQRHISHAVLPLVGIIILMAILAMLSSFHYAKALRHSIVQLNGTFAKVAKGTLSNTVPPELLARKDEFGEMAHSVLDMQSALRKLVDEDMLTGLSNRRSGQIRLQQAVNAMSANGDGFCLALGDIDFFKKFNDNYGHDCGDLVLQQISAILQQQVKDYGVCARWGGEEFLILFSRGSFNECKDVMEHTLEVIRSHHINYQNQVLSVTMTFGLINTSGMKTADDMVKHVDELLYYGKEHGRNRLVTESEVV